MTELEKNMAIKSCESRFEREALKALWRLADSFEDIAEYLQAKNDKSGQPGGDHRDCHVKQRNCHAKDCLCLQFVFDDKFGRV